jgi:hypothetical protein
LSTTPGSFISLREGEAHLGIAPDTHALRVLLGAPDDPPLEQWYMTVPLIDRRLKGCCWKIVGTIVPITSNRPGFPFVQYSQPQPRRLQAWLWRVFKSPPPPYPRRLPPGWMRPFGDIRWHPDRGMWVTLELGRDDGPEVAQRVWQWVHHTQLHVAGRPLLKGAYESAEAFLRAVLPAIRAVRALDGDLTQARVMAEMGWAGDTSRLREQARKFGYSWSELIRLA